jgi:hypothetical protein
MLLGPRIEFKPIERHALRANSNYGDVWADFAIETVLAHAEIARGVTEAEEAREEVCVRHGVENRCARGPDQRRSASASRSAQSRSEVRRYAASAGEVQPCPENNCEIWQ